MQCSPCTDVTAVFSQVMNDPLPEIQRSSKMEPLSLRFSNLGMLTRIEDEYGGRYELQTMWSRAVTSDCSVGPNRDRHAVPDVLGNTAVRPCEPRLSGKEATPQLTAIAIDLCNLRRLPGRYRNINKSSLASFQKRLVRSMAIQGRRYWLLLAEGT
jgi:hypothetical protein